MANKIVSIDVGGTPFIKIFIINNFRHIAHIESDKVFTKTELNDLARKIKKKLDKDIVLDHYDPILNTFIFHTT